MKQGTLIGPTIIAIGLVSAAMIFALVGAVLQTADGGLEMRLDRAHTQLNTLTSNIEQLTAELNNVQNSLRRQSEDIALLASRTPQSAPSTFQNATGSQSAPGPGAHIITQEPTEIMKLAKLRFNIGITQPRNSTMLELLGQPRSQYGTDCQPITNQNLKNSVETRQVGPIKVTLLRPALESLERIMGKLKTSEPDLHDALGTAGGLCVRLVRGSKSSISNHSFGTAIDLKLEGKIDGFGDGGTQFGLLLLAELFNAEGWYWGATYNREDSMHFEVGEETLRRWRAKGQI